MRADERRVRIFLYVSDRLDVACLAKPAFPYFTRLFERLFFKPSCRQVSAVPYGFGSGGERRELGESIRLDKAPIEMDFRDAADHEHMVCACLVYYVFISRVNAFCENGFFRESPRFAYEFVRPAPARISVNGQDIRVRLCQSEQLVPRFVGLEAEGRKGFYLEYEGDHINMG